MSILILLLDLYRGVNSVAIYPQFVSEQETWGTFPMLPPQAE